MTHSSMMVLADKLAALSLWPMDIMSISIITSAAFTVLMSVTVIWRLMRGDYRQKLPEDPTCGKCGYIVRGLSSSTCPECGSDLRTVGVIPPNTPRPPTIFQRCSNWTVMLLLIALFLSGIGRDRFEPMTYTNTMLRTVSCLIDRLQMTITIETKGTAVYWRGKTPAPYIPPQELILTDCNIPGQLRQLRMNLGTRDWTLTDVNNKTVTGKDFNVGAILTLLEAKGFNRSDQRVCEVAEHIHKAVQEQIDSCTPLPGWDKNRQNAFFATSQVTVLPFQAQPFAATTYVLVIFWLLVWLLSMWLIIRHFRRKQPFPYRDWPAPEA